jgi:hypothetical protein
MEGLPDPTFGFEQPNLQDLGDLVLQGRRDSAVEIAPEPTDRPGKLLMDPGRRPAGVSCGAALEFAQHGLTEAQQHMPGRIRNDAGGFLGLQPLGELTEDAILQAVQPRRYRFFRGVNQGRRRIYVPSAYPHSCCAKQELYQNKRAVLVNCTTEVPILMTKS